MADNKVFQTYEGLPPWARGLVVVGGLVLVYVVGNTVYKKLFPSQDLIDAQNRVKQASDDAKKLENNGVSATFADTQYNNFADAIAAAFSGCDSSSPWIPATTNYIGYSNSGTTVYNIIHQFNNDLDFLNLQTAFGTKTIVKSWVCGGDYTNVDLAGAVTNQLNSVEIKGINDELTKRGITYRF